VPAKAAKANSDGTWTVVDAVAYVDEQHKSGKWYTQNTGYATLEEAIAASGKYAYGDKGYTVTLVDDAEVTGNVVVTEGTTLVCGDYSVVLAAADATLTAPEDLNVTTSVENATVEYTEGVYSVKEFDYVLWVKEQLLAGNNVTLDRDIVVDGSMIESIPAPTNGNGKYPNYGIFNVVGDYEVTFDLNGHTITYNGHKSFQWNGKTYSSCAVAHGVFFANAGADLTVIDSSADKTGTVMVYGLASGAYVASNDTTFTIEGGTWKNEGCETCGGTNIFLYPLQGGELYIKGGHFEQALDSEGESYLIVEHGGEYANSVIDYSKTKVEITGGTFVGMNPEEIKYFQQTADNKLVMGESTDGCANGFAAVDNGDGTYGITYAVNVSAYDKVTGEKFWIEFNQDNFDLSYVEMMDHDNYNWVLTLKNDVVVTESIVVNKELTIDLCGKTISMADASGATAALLKNNSTLTITDSSDEKTGKLTFNSTTPSASNAYASNTIRNDGVLTIEGGIIENTTVGGACYALDNYAGSTATIKGGKLVAEKTAVRIFNWTDGDAAKATLNVEGGEILSKDGYGININSGNAPAVELNISGGTITTNDTDYNLAVYIIHKGSAENQTVNVTGGTFNGYFALNGVTCSTMAEDAVSISDGTFDGVICYADPAYGFITGGTYNSEVEKGYCAKGYIPADNGDGTWTVVPNQIFEMHLVDANGDAHWLSPMRSNDLNSLIEKSKVWYESLQGTYSFTLKVLESYELDETVLATFPMTIDLCGNTLTVAETMNATPAIRVLSDVTVKNGTVDATAGTSTYAFIVGNSTTAGTLTIVDGTYKGRVSVASVTKGTLTIEGGNFEATEYEGAHEFTLNCIDANYTAGTAKIVVKGGTFVGFNPEANAAEGADTNFVAEGYGAEEAEGVWTVKPIVTVKFNDVTMVDGNELPEFTYTTNFTEIAEDGMMLIVEEPAVTVNGIGEYEITAEASVFMSDAYIVRVTPGTLTVKEAFVEMDGVYYTTIKDALGTLRSADTTVHTVKVLKDLDIDVNYSTYNYPILVNGFAIVLDLNGKTITADWSKYTGSRKDNSLIGMANGGKLTVVDTVGGGTIRNMSDGKDDVENRMFWLSNSHTTKETILTIEGGTFVQEEDIHLLYVEGNKSGNGKMGYYVYIKGGDFQMIGYNDFFNSYDGYAQETIISGGTFNVDPTDWETKFPEGYKAAEIEDGIWSIVPKDYVAQVGETKYESLQEAINACTNGETVKLIADVTYDADDVVYAHGGATGFGDYDQYNPAIVYVGGTRVDGVNSPSNVNAVIDLNGHIITNNADAYLFLFMDNCKITFKDSVGTGAVVGNTEAPVIWSTGTETVVTIESGKYSIGEYGSLIWATHSGDLVIKGGEFSTTAEDASCLIMRNEQNRQNSEFFISGKSTVTVTGGTFHGFNPEKMLDDSKTPAYEFNAVAEGYVAVADEEANTWTVMTVIEAGYVAQNTADGVYYKTVAEALSAANSGETVKLIADCSGGYVMVTPGVTLDLNGYTLTADYVVGFNGSNVVDNSEANTGLLVVDDAKNVVLAETNSQLPVWTGEGYIFVEILKFQETGRGTNTYIFLPTFEEIAHQYLAQGMENSKVKIAIRMTWNIETGTAYQDFIYNNTTVGNVINSYSNGRYGQVFNAIMNNSDSIDFTLSAVLISETGAEIILP